MSLEALLSDTVDIYRVVGGAGIVTSYNMNSPLYSGVSCLIQPMVPEFTAKTDFTYGRLYRCLLPINTDIQLSDRVIDENGKTYQVTGTLNRDYGIAVQHLTVTMTEEAKEGPDQ
jgi:hypothetical protein